MATLVGEAAVRIVPSFENFRKRLEAELKATNKHLDIEVRPQTAKATARMKAWRERQEANAINIDVDVDTDSLKAARLELKRTEHVFKKSPLRQSLVVGVLVTGASALPALAQGAASATTAITSLAQGAAILPGLLAGALSSVGVLATGLSGLGTALTEYSQNQATASDRAKDAVAINRDLARAQRDYNTAVKDAYRNLQDLKLELKGTSLSQADALLSLREAERDYYKGGFKDALDQQRAWLGVLQAKQRVDETTLKNTRTNQDAYTEMQKGVSGADGVVDALDRVADATKRLTESAEGTDAYKKAMAALAPAGREFVEEIFKLKDAWKEFQQVTQQALLKGAAASITDFVNTSLPMLTKGSEKIAAGMNATFRSALSSLGEAGNQGLLSRIFGDTSGFWQNLSKGMDPFLSGLLKLSDAGSSFLPRLGAAFTDVSNRFDAFLTRAADDGSLQKWIDRGLNALTTLGNSFLDIGSIFNSVSQAFRAVSGDQNGLIDSMGRGLAGLADWAKSNEGQGSLIQYFQKAKQFIEDITPGVQAIITALNTMSEAARDVFGFLSPILGTINDLLGENTDLLEVALAAYLGFKLVSPLISGVTTALGFLNKAAQILPTTLTSTTLPGLSQMQTKLRDVEDSVGKGGIRGSGVGKGLSGAIGGLATLIGPAGLLLAGVTAAIIGIDKLGDAHDRATKQALDQKAALDGLVNSMDNVSGAATAAGREQVAQSAQSFTIPGTAGPDGKRNILQDAQRVGIDSKRLVDLTDPTQEGSRNAELARLDPMTLRAVEASPDWQAGKKDWESVGITADIMAKAVGGDQGAQDQVTAAQKKLSADRGIAKDGAPDWIREPLEQAARATGVLPPTQTDIMLSAGTPDAATTSTFLRKNAGARLTQGAAIQERTRAAGGRNRLNAAGLGQFGAFNPSGDAGLSNGQITQVLDKIPDAATQAAWGEKGIQTIPLDNGRVQVTFPESAFSFIEGYKRGGVLGGIGNGTSDSNLIRASKGEAIIPAHSVASNRGLVDSLISGNVPHLEGGGWGFGPKKPVVPAPTPNLASPSRPSFQSAGPLLLGGAGGASGNPGIPGVGSGNSLGSFILGGGSGSVVPPLGSTPVGAPRGVGSTTGLNRAGFDRLKGFDPSISYTTKPAAISLQTKTNPAMDYGELGRAPGTGIGNSLAAKPAQQGNATSFYNRLGMNIGGKPSGWQTPTPPLTNSFYEDWYKKPVPAAPVTQSSGYTPLTSAQVTNPGLISPVPSTQIGVRGSGPAPGPVSTTPVAAVGSSSTPIYANTPMGVAPSGPVMSQLKSFAAQAEQLPYVWGGFGPNGYDCSGLAAAMANIATGQDPLAGGRFSTANEASELAKRGFQPGDGGAGTLTIGWSDSHTGVTLPDGTHIDAQGTESGIVMGEGSPGATGFPNVMHLPIPDTGISIPNAPILGPGGVPLPPGGGMPSGGILGALGMGGGGGAPGNILGSLFGGGSGSGGSPDDIINNAAKGLGGIAMQFLGGFFGIDLSQITGAAGSILGGLGAGKADPNAQALIDGFSSGQTPAEGMAYPDGSGATGSLYGGPGSSAAYDPNAGAEQWRGLATQIVTQLAPQYGITNVKGWVDDIVKQIDTESKGNPFVDNPNDTDGKGGTQTVKGLGQFLPSTFDAHNILKGTINDPSSVIAAMVDYVSTKYVPKYGMDADGSPPYIGQGHGYALGGRVRGPGSTTSDSIPAMLSRDEHVTRAKATNYYGHGVFDKLNSMSIPRDQVAHLALGGWGANPLSPLLNQPPPGVPSAASGNPGPQPQTPPPAAAGTANAPSLPGPAPTPLGGAGASGAPGATAPAPNGGAPLPQPSVQDQAGTVQGALGAAAGITGGGAGAQPGATPTAGATDQVDPRSVLGAAPTSNDHLNPGLKSGIEGAFQTAGNIGAMAASAAGAAVPGAGGAASSLISGGAQVAGQVASGIANVVASGLVGSLTPGSTAGAYGTPLLPTPPASTQGTVPAIANTYNGGISVGNYEQFDAGQRRREAQNAMPFLNAK